MGYNDQLDKPKSKFPKFFNRKKLLITIGVILLLLVISVVAWMVWWNSSPYATVDGHKISLQEYKTEKTQLEKFYKYNKDTNSLKNIDQITKDTLTEDAIIRAESEKRVIKVSAAEINVEYQKLVKKYKSEAEFIQTIKSAYDFTPQLAKNAIELRLLKEKLQPEVLKGYSVKEYLVRYDLGTKGLSENPSSKGAIEAAYTRLQQGSTMEKLAPDPICQTSQSSICVIASISNVNEATATSIFFASKGEDYAAISKLTKVGQITGIVKSSGGYYVVYRADSIGGGKYTTWDEFIKDYKSHYVSYGMATKITEGYKQLAYMLSEVFNFNTIALAVSASSDGSNCSHDKPNGPDDVYSPIDVSGHVYDAVTNWGIDSASVRIYIMAYGGSCYKMYTTKAAQASKDYSNSVNFCPTCNRANNAVTANANGYYYFQGANALECHFQWHWDFSATGYISKSFDHHPASTEPLANGQAMPNANVYLTPEVHTLHIKIVDLNGASGKVTSNIVGTDGQAINCTDNSGVCSITFYAQSEPKLTETANVGFIHGFSSTNNTTGVDLGSNPALPCNLNGPDCQVRMGHDRYITATFDKTPGDPGDNPAPDPGPDPGPAPEPVPVPPPSWTLNPHVSLDKSIIQAGDSFSVTAGVTSFGPDSSDSTTCVLTRTVNGALTNTYGCDQSFSPGETPVYSSTDNNTSSLSLGDRICYVLTVNPYSTNDPGQPKSSPLDAACVTIAKSPKTNIIRGDLIVGGKVSTSTATISGITYGSWAEYGIIASGGIEGAASGAAFAGPGMTGYTLSKASALTFANTGLTSGCDPTQPSIKPTGGCYKSAAITPPLTASFPTSSTTYLSGTTLDSLDSGTYSATGTIKITGGDIKVGQSIIINAPTATVNITGDITYDTSTSLTSIKDIPQVVIIANDIEIASGVKNIDAWLIAQNQGGVDGVINTCSDVMPVSAPLSTIDSCYANQLVVNGPVMTNHLYLRRTTGSTVAKPGDPAEVFNLPASAYLWSISRASSNTGNVQAVYSTELPPRY